MDMIKIRCHNWWITNPNTKRSQTVEVYKGNGKSTGRKCLMIFELYLGLTDKRA